MFEDVRIVSVRPRAAAAASLIFKYIVRRIMIVKLPPTVYLTCRDTWPAPPPSTGLIVRFGPFKHYNTKREIRFSIIYRSVFYAVYIVAARALIHDALENENV